MKKIYSILLTLLFVGVGTTLKAESFFVKPSATGGGSSWSDAASLEDALSWAADGDEIFVAKGTYTGSFKSRKLIKVYGNCVETETTAPEIKSADGLETFLKGEKNGKRVLYIDGKASEWIGFDISNGDATEEATGVGRGGGVYINNGGATLKYCRIHNNVGIDGSKRKANDNGNPLKGVGGGVYALHGNLVNCIIENNVATSSPWDKGGGIWAGGIGGGICLDATEGNSSTPETAIALNCIIKNNSTTPSDDKDSYASQGGGIAIKSGKLVNSLIIGNSVNGSKNNQSIGGGVACTQDKAYIINCTAVKNTTVGLGGGISFQTTNAGNMTASVANCIAWGNISRDDSYGTGNENIRFGSSTDGALVGKVTISAIVCPQATVTAGTITADPKFTDPANGNYSLQVGGPAIDAGDDPAIDGFTLDLAGNPRIKGDAVDIGAYEYQEGGQGLEGDVEDYGTIIDTQYYNLQGLRLTEPTVSGVYIVKDTYSTQRTVTRKSYIDIR